MTQLREAGLEPPPVRARTVFAAEEAALPFAGVLAQPAAREPESGPGAWAGCAALGRPGRAAQAASAIVFREWVFRIIARAVALDSVRAPRVWAEVGGLRVARGRSRPQRPACSTPAGDELPSAGNLLLESAAAAP